MLAASAAAQFRDAARATPGPSPRNGALHCLWNLLRDDPRGPEALVWRSDLPARIVAGLVLSAPRSLLPAVAERTDLTTAMQRRLVRRALSHDGAEDWTDVDARPLQVLAANPAVTDPAVMVELVAHLDEWYLPSPDDHWRDLARNPAFTPDVALRLVSSGGRASSVRAVTWVVAAARTGRPPSGDALAAALAGALPLLRDRLIRELVPLLPPTAAVATEAPNRGAPRPALSRG